LAQLPVDTSKAAEFWRSNLDPQNLDQGSDSGVSLEDELAFVATPEFEEAWKFVAALRAQQNKLVVLDIGAGLGACSIVMERRGATVIAMDTSLPRLRQLGNRAKQAGGGEKILRVVASAEHLPFKSHSIPAAFTKSVLIHTDLEKAADEIGRILALGGGAALIEPMKRNPFAWLYRKTLAPREWQGITHYFDEDMQWKICASKIAALQGTEVKHFYFFSFLAFIFQFAIPARRFFFGLLSVLHANDRGLFSLFPFLKRFAWFGVILSNARGVPSENQSAETRQT